MSNFGKNQLADSSQIPVAKNASSDVLMPKQALFSAQICQWPDIVQWCCNSDQSESSRLSACTKSSQCSDPECVFTEPCAILTYFMAPLIVAFALCLGASILVMTPFKYQLRMRWKIVLISTLLICFAASFSNLAFFVSTVGVKAPHVIALYFAALSLSFLLLVLKCYKRKLQIRNYLGFGFDLGVLVIYGAIIGLQLYITIQFPNYYFSTFLTSVLIHSIVFVILLLALVAQVVAAIGRRGFTDLNEESYITNGCDLGIGEDRVGVFSYTTIGWITPLMNRGWFGYLNSVDDTFFLPRDIDIPTVANKLEAHLQRELESSREFIEAEIEETYGDVIVNEKDYDPEEDGDDKIVIVEPPSRGLCCSGLKRPSKFSLMKVFFQVFGWSIVPQFFFRIASDACSLCSPVFLNLFITYLSDESQEASFNVGASYGLAMIGLTILGTIFEQMYFYRSWKVTFRARGSMMVNIYRKLLKVNQCKLSKFSSGEIVNFMSRDAFNISYIPLYSHQFFAMPVNVIAVLVLLYWQVGISFLAGVFLCLLCVPFNQWLSGRIIKYDVKYYEHRDERVKVVTELLNGIRTVKLAALEEFFARKIATIRNKEIFNIRRLKFLDAFCVYIWAALPVLLGVAIFTSYASLGHTVSAATVFTVLCYVNLLIGPLNSFPWILNTLIEAYVSFKRLNNYFALKNFDADKFYSESGDLTPSQFDDDSEHSDTTPTAENGDRRNAVRMRNAVFSYGRKSEEVQNVKSVVVRMCLRVLCMSHENENPDPEPNNKGFQKLQNINLSIDHGNFIGVFGKVGAGKTSLLSAVIGEMNKQTGSVKTSESSRGFGLVPQESWLQTGTIRDNILLGSSYNKAWYEKVIKACALIDDLKSLPDSDLTQVGERGITLSGGQKARVNLARALYKNFDVYLLDDPMSAVDAHVAAHIYKKCIRGVLRNKTVILCTHHVQYLREANSVVHLENGFIASVGSPESVLPESAGEFKEDDEIHETQAKADGKDLVLADRENPDYQADELVDEDEQGVGDVDLKLYVKYFEASGKFLCVITLVALTLMQASKNSSDWWLTFWTDSLNKSAPVASGTQPTTPSLYNDYRTRLSHNFYHINFIHVGHENSETYEHLSLPYRIRSDVVENNADDYRFYLLIYGLIAMFNSFFSLFRAFSFAIANIRASIRIHETLLDSVMKFKNSIFSVTPVGRIVNRFSSDVSVLDDDLPFMFNILLGQSFTAMGLLIVILVSVPYIIPLVLIMMLVFYRLQRYYRKSSRELRRIATANMSPVYHHFNESLYGASVIKAMQIKNVFMDENERRVVRANRARFNERAVQRWFGIRVQLVSAVILMLSIAVGLFQKQFAPHLIKSGLLGLCLSYCLTIRSTLTQLLATFAENEKNIISVERIDDYSDPEKFEKLEGEIKSEELRHWPNKGSIEFKDVTLRYGDDETKDPALRNLCMRIEGGEKVGICGRTGAGKSSILSVLFRLEQICGGKIFIDGIDIGQVPVRFLRSRLSIIPQDPFLFTGTVRENLDQSPDDSKVNDDELWQALERAHMREAVEKLGGLDAEVGEKGQYFSAGQKQLICLARALLLDTKILCLDEATANVDTETDSKIQQTIREEFQNRTVITIAHRINTILHCGKVIVLSKGQVCEEGAPMDLIEQEDSHFALLVAQSGTNTHNTS